LDELVFLKHGIGVIAVYINPLLAIWFFVNFITIIRKVVKDEKYTSMLWIGSIILAWLFFHSLSSS